MSKHLISGKPRVFVLVVSSLFWIAASAKFVTAANAHADVAAPSPRTRDLIDTGWRFALGHAYDPSKDFNFTTGVFYNAKAANGDGPASLGFDDRGWRRVDLPHDWAVETPFDPNGDTGHGAKCVGRPYPDSSVGWYRRSLTIPASDWGKRIGVEFDGAFRDAQVFLNGHDVGRCLSGYDSFRCDLTDVLNYGGANTLVVRLDATLREGWFYEGAGLYRHVWLTKTNPVHVAANGSFVTADTVTDLSSDAISAGSAALKARATIENESARPAVLDVHQSVMDDQAKPVADVTLHNQTVEPGDSVELPTQLTVSNPKLWSLQSPVLYTLVTTIEQNGVEVDQYRTHFGIRTLRFDKDQGFFLNGRHVLIKGTCNHQDAAGVGVALPDAMQTFRINRLKEMGCNAIRTSHNPPTPELLDACDRLGMLVLDENRRTGTAPQAVNGLHDLIVRDRNHPCIFLWSLGNEEWHIEGSVIGQRVVEAQRELVHRLDPSRLVTTAVSGGWGDGSSRSIDVMGFNYYTHGNVDDYHAKHPDQPCIGSEEGSTTTTRGTYALDNAKTQLAAYGDTAPSWASTAQNWMTFYDARPFVAGAFVWTGFDYRGETTPFNWPAISSQFGILDTCGFPKDEFFYYQSCWTDKPMVHVLPHWNWPGKDGLPIDVRCYSNCDEVELTLNGKSLGRQPVQRHKQLKWSVNYAPGTLSATAYKAGEKAATDEVQTTGSPSALQLIPDRSTIAADGRDLSVITVRSVDAQGRLVPTANNLIHFTVQGPGKIIGVGNGDPACHEPDVYVEQVQSITVSNWKSKPASADNIADVAESADDSQWTDPASSSGSNVRSALAPRVYRAAVEIPADHASAVAVFLSHASADTQVFINGKRVDYTATVGGLMRVGRNTIAVATIVEKGKRLGVVIRRSTPPAPWQRSLFYGLAQLIVQSSGAPGPITVTASSDAVTAGTLTLAVR